jgi:hypothetical protein
MKLVANIQLTPTKDEAKLLWQTLEACNAACNAASQPGQFSVPLLARLLARPPKGLVDALAVIDGKRLGSLPGVISEPPKGTDGIPPYRP